MSRTMIIEESKNAFIEALFRLLKCESFETYYGQTINVRIWLFKKDLLSILQNQNRNSRHSILQISNWLS